MGGLETRCRTGVLPHAKAETSIKECRCFEGFLGRARMAAVHQEARLVFFVSVSVKGEAPAIFAASKAKPAKMGRSVRFCICVDIAERPAKANLDAGELAGGVFGCQCRDKTPAILPVLPTRGGGNLGGDAVGTLQ